MKFSVKSSDLQRALAKTISVVPSRSTLPILENILFTIQKNKLEITATDLEISVSVALDVNGSQDGSIAVPAKRISDTVRALPDLMIMFSIDTESNKIVMKTERGEYTLTGESSEEFPSMPQFKSEKDISINPETLQKIISNTLFAVSTDELRPAMMGVLLQLEKSNLRAVSTDGHRLVKINRSNAVSANLTKDIIIPAKALNLVEKLSGGTQNVISVNDTHILFRFGNTSLISRLIEEKYPNYETVIPGDNEKKLLVNKDEILQSVRRVSLYSSSTTHQIRLSIRNSELTIAAEDVDFGSEAKEVVSCEYSDDDMEIGFNSAYIVDILSHINSDEVILKFNSPNRAAIIVPQTQPDGEDTLMLVMPVRLNN